MNECAVNGVCTCAAPLLLLLLVLLLLLHSGVEDGHDGELHIYGWQGGASSNIVRDRVLPMVLHMSAAHLEA
jgi:hypothetical protein